MPTLFKSTLLVFFLSFQSQIYSQWNTLNTGIPQNLFSITHAGQGILYTCGAKGTLLKSIDSGITWQNKSLNGLENLRYVHFANPELGFICGENAVIYRTTDSGKTWSQRHSLNNKYLNSISVNEGKMVAVGREGYFLVSQDTGQTWNQISTFTTKFFYSSAATSDGRFLIGSDSGFLYYLNSGLDTLTSLKLQTNLRINRIQCLSPSFCVVSGGNADTTGGNAQENFLAVSTDSLKTWQFQNFEGKRQFNSAYFFNPDSGYFAQPSGVIAHSFDAGQSFGEHYVGSPINLADVFFFDSKMGVAVGDVGRIFTTQNGGGWGLNTRDLANDKTFKISPNPAQNTLYVNSNESGIMFLFDSSGRLLRQFDINQFEQQILLEGLTTGIYLYRFCNQQGNFIQSGRLVVEN